MIPVPVSARRYSVDGNAILYTNYNVRMLAEWSRRSWHTRNVDNHEFNCKTSYSLRWGLSLDVDSINAHERPSRFCLGTKRSNKIRTGIYKGNHFTSIPGNLYRNRVIDQNQAHFSDEQVEFAIQDRTRTAGRRLLWISRSGLWVLLSIIFTTLIVQWISRIVAYTLCYLRYC